MQQWQAGEAAAVAEAEEVQALETFGLVLPLAELVQARAVGPGR